MDSTFIMLECLKKKEMGAMLSWDVQYPNKRQIKKNK